MTREQAKANLIALGIAEEPTAEQITNYLNQFAGETKKITDGIDDLKNKSSRAEELQAELDKLQNQNLSDIERANKETEKANNRIAELEMSLKKMNLKNDLATNGIVGENADKLIESISNGSFDAGLLGQIISDREKTAISEYERKALEGTKNPQGESGKSEKDNKPDDVKNAESLTFGTLADKSQESREYYM